MIMSKTPHIWGKAVPDNDKVKFQSEKQHSVGRYSSKSDRCWMLAFVKSIIQKIFEEEKTLIHISVSSYSSQQKADCPPLLIKEIHTHMGQILQDGENGCFMSNFFLK